MSNTVRDLYSGLVTRRYYLCIIIFFFFKQKTAYEMRISDWSSDVCSSDLIIVTATKRNENLSQVPIAVSVTTDEDIAAKGIVRPQDYLISTPNVTFVDEPTGERFTNIRGQTSVRNSDQNDAVVIDGVQLSSLTQFNPAQLTIQHIEDAH